ncbi:MAG: FMN-binding protein [Methylococcales bacterium]|nr:FMN-binding protein [Methylococcales bacterium]
MRFRFLLIVLLAIGQPTLAKVYYSKQEAMVLAFGDQAEVSMVSLFPSAEQSQRIEQLAKTKLDSGLYTLYAGKIDGQVKGYAAIETQTVRTKPETLLLVLSADGHLEQVVTLAFHEPPEYEPPERWFQLLSGKPIEELDFAKGVQAISGATLSTRAALTAARKVLAIYQVMIEEAKP